MKRTITLALLFTVGCFACQPTPDKDIIVNKGERHLEESIAGTPAPIMKATELTRWTESYEIPDLSVRIDAEIELPDAAQYPVFLLREGAFTVDRVNQVVDGFTQGATGMCETTESLEELQAKWLALHEWSEYTKARDNGDRDNTIPDENHDWLAEGLAELEEKMRNAQPAAFAPVGPLQSHVARYSYAMPNDAGVHVDTCSWSMYISREKNTAVQAESDIFYGGALPGEEGNAKIEGIAVREEDARAQVTDLLAALGIDNMGIAAVEKARLVQYNTIVLSKGYQFVLTRNDGGGLAVDIDRGNYHGIIYFPQENYDEFPEGGVMEVIYMERITVYVDETGVREFTWQFPLTPAEVLNENASLLPFEEIQERIRQSIRLGYGNSTDWRPEGRSYTAGIDRIVLSYLMTPAKNQPDCRLFQPVWLVFYSYDDWVREEAMFALNAIDGSVIHMP